MALEQLSAPAPAVEMKTAKRKTEAEKIYDSIHAKVAEVLPFDDKESWQWTSEDYETHAIEQPTDSFEEWLSEKYVGSDEFTQRLVRRMFTIWQEMEEGGFEANDKRLYEHQKALFGWIAISTATGVREKMAKLLVRSPYGSGKSLVAGLVGLAFRQTQEEMMAEDIDPKTVPSVVLLGLRKEHMLQNAVGEQNIVLQPPYTVERADINVYWKNLATLFGEDFTNHFSRPKGIGHPFYKLFNISEDEEDLPPATERIRGLLESMERTQQKTWNDVPQAKRKKIMKTLSELIDGKVIFIPDIDNVPQPERTVPREEVGGEEETRYRGDAGFPFVEREGYRVKTSHKHLALDKSAYTTQPNMEDPAKALLAYGSMVTRTPESIRIDIREEVLKLCKGLIVDEAGSFTPSSLGDSIAQVSGQSPYIVGFTGGDRGIDGWKRSPVLSEKKMIELGLMKPIAFQGIGDAKNPPAQGSEEAWDAYAKNMFKDEKTAKTLGLPQPHQLDTVVVAPTNDVREYAHRIQEAHKAEGVPVKIWCFDPAAGDSRWSIIVNGFNAPKQDGDPKRILVAPPSQMSEALHLHAECYDVLANMRKYPIDQTRGRLGHIRNNEKTASAREKARTYFRVQWLEGAQGEPYIREMADMIGFELKDENATWPPLHAMIDLDAYERDEERNGLSKPEAIPDSLAVQKRKKRMTAKKEWTKLKSTGTFSIKRDERTAQRLAARGWSGETESSASPHASNGQPVSKAAAPPKPPEMKLEEHTAKIGEKGERTLTLRVDKNGCPVNFEELTALVGNYGGSLVAHIRYAYSQGSRGKDLAKIAAKEVSRLWEVIDRRAKASSGTH